MKRQTDDGVAQPTTPDPASGRVGRWRWAPVLAAVVTGAVALVLLVVQVEVSDSELGVTRTCGSGFDTVVDRSGWETWWAHDLDEPDAAVRAALIRTERCPAAINRQLAAAAVFGVASLLLGTRGVLRRRATQRRTEPSTSSSRLVRLGRITTWIGAMLTVAGAAAIVVLVADADSTLFLYTDRFVVGVVGLIVLVPTIALVVIGRALELTGSQLAESEPPDAESDDA